MWKVVYFVLASGTPITFEHPTAFYTDVECVKFLEQEDKKLYRPGIEWHVIHCVFDPTEIKH